MLCLCLFLWGGLPAADAQQQEAGQERDTGQEAEQEREAPPESEQTEPGRESKVEVAPMDPGRLAAKERPPRGAALENIVVTASKREQNLRDVAGSVGAFSGDQLEEMNARDMADFLKLDPGVSYNKGEFGPSSTAPSIRGINTDTGPRGGGNPTPESTGVFIDDIPFGTSLLSMQFPDMSPFDLERVEILKGPQGTLFGAQSLAGAIHYITHKPELGLWQTKFQGSYTNVLEGEQDGTGNLAVNMPLGGRAALRAVGVYRKAPGYIDEINRGDEDINPIRQRAGRLLGLWEVNDRLSLSAVFFRQKDEQPDIGTADQRKRLERGFTPFEQPNEQVFGLGNFVVDYDLGWASLKSSSSRKIQDSFVVADLTGFVGAGQSGTPSDPDDPTSGPGGEDQDIAKIVTSTTKVKVWGYAQELRLTSPDIGNWKWLAGAYFQRDRQLVDARSELIELVELPVVGAPPEPPTVVVFPTPIGVVDPNQFASFSNGILKSTSKEWALYGETSFLLDDVWGLDWLGWLDDRWELTLGGRFFRTSYDALTIVEGGLISTAITIDPEDLETQPTNALQQVERGFNPRVSLQFRPNSDIMIYGLASRGFQFGGTQLVPKLPSLSDEQVPPTFDSSSLYNFELGARTDWLNGSLTLDATLFWLKWRNLQLTSRTNDPTGTRTVEFAFIDNVGAARSRGGELSLRIAPAGDLAIPFTGLSFPLSDFTFRSSLGITEAETTVAFEDPATGELLPPGTPLPGTAKYQAANVLEYRPQLGGWSFGWDPSLSLTHVFVGKSFSNLTKDQEIGDYNTFDARLSLRNSNIVYQPELKLSVVNVFDKRGVSGARNDLDAVRLPIITFIQPRTAEVTLGMRFN